MSYVMFKITVKLQVMADEDELEPLANALRDLEEETLRTGPAERAPLNLAPLNIRTVILRMFDGRETGQEISSTRLGWLVDTLTFPAWVELTEAMAERLESTANGGSSFEYELTRDEAFVELDPDIVAALCQKITELLRFEDVD